MTIGLIVTVVLLLLALQDACKIGKMLTIPLIATVVWLLIAFTFDVRTTILNIGLIVVIVWLVVVFILNSALFAVLGQLHELHEPEDAKAAAVPKPERKSTKGR